MMQTQTLKHWQRHTIWLSILGHLLLLFGMTVVIVFSKPPLPSASAPAAISSYLTPSPPSEAAAETQPTPPTQTMQAEQMAQPEPLAKPEPLPEIKDPDAIPLKKAQPKPATKAASKPAKHTPQFAKDAIPEDITSPVDQEPLHLVGESKIVPPLIKILARALSRHLFYPRVAAEFNLRGIVLVGFTLHPEGYVTGAKVVKSSGAGVLDDAARDAIGAMSPVGDVHAYVEAPEFMVVGIIFG